MKYSLFNIRGKRKKKLFIFVCSCHSDELWLQKWGNLPWIYTEWWLARKINKQLEQFFYHCIHSTILHENVWQTHMWRTHYTQTHTRVCVLKAFSVVENVIWAQSAQYHGESNSMFYIFVCDRFCLSWRISIEWRIKKDTKTAI